MKTRTITLSTLAIVVLLVVGALAFIRPGASTILIAEQVKIEPKPLDIYNPDTVTVYVKLSVNDEPIVEQIDPDTVLLEDSIAPTNWWTTRRPSKEFVAQFDGQQVVGAIWDIIGHMGITRPHPWTPVKIPLKISGYLYDGITQWEGIGEAKVYIHNPGPPPPPPPP